MANLHLRCTGVVVLLVVDEEGCVSVPRFGGLEVWRPVPRFGGLEEWCWQMAGRVFVVFE